MSGQLRGRHLLLLVPVLLASAPAAQALPASLEVRMGPSAMAGVPASLTVVALDALGQVDLSYVGTIGFSSTDSRALLPPDTLLTLADQGQKTFYITFGTAGLQAVMVEDILDPNLRGESGNIQVAPGVLHELVLSALPSTQVEACTQVRLGIEAVDAFGNRVGTAPDFSLCGAPGHSASAVQATDTLEVTRDGDCFHGNLPPEGIGAVRLENPNDETVTFTATSTLTLSVSSITLGWRSGNPHAESSSLSFRESTDEIPLLQTFTGQLSLRLELRDACGGTAAIPSGKTLSFAGESPLFLGTPPVQEGDGRWTVSVRLPECPSTGVEPLALWPTLDGKPLVGSTGQRLQRQVQPRCIAPDVELSVRPGQEGVVPAPGEVVELVVTLQNKGQASILNGLLELGAEGLTVLEASLEGQPLTPRGEGFILPELPPGATLTVKVRAQITTAQLDHPAKATVWYATAEGAALTEKKVLSFDLDGLGVDVGCGCHAGAPPSQLLPLLVLLGLASRPRARSRRLGRGERTHR